MYTSKIYKDLKEVVESNMIACIQQDLSDGKVPYTLQMREQRMFNLGVIAGVGMVDKLYAKEIVRLNNAVNRLYKYKCEWSKK